MGYYTYYNLNVTTNNEETLTKIVEKFEERGLIDYVFDRSLSSYEGGTWYDWRDDMREISQLFPEVRFTLHGEGQNAEDLWEAHFLNGKMQYCPAVITYANFDESKLE